MDLLNGFLGFGGNAVVTIAAFLFVLTIVVFFHELGHFLAARWCGVKVEAFSVGFGKEIWAFVDRHGTRWRLAWIPLGGYVKFMGDENAASVPSREAIDKLSEEDRAGNFHAKPLWQRAFIVAAGPLANFILAVLIFASLYAIVGHRVTAALVDEIQADSAAAEAGFEIGDQVISIDGSRIESFADMQRIVSTSADRTLSFVVRRNGREVELKATPKRREITDRFGNKLRVGLLGVRRSANAQDWEFRRHGPASAVWLGMKETSFIVTTTLSYLKGIITGREKADQMRGPLGIAEVSGQMARAGLAALLHLSGVLSVSIGLINLFPVPMLDGGHLMFYGIEAVRQRPLSERTQEIGFRIGLAFVLMLMVFATWNDLLHVAQKFL
jgi:regulator of sigma E protease